jgi:hypothetical protein
LYLPCRALHASQRVFSVTGTNLMSSHVTFLEPASQSAQFWGTVSQCLQLYIVLKWIHMMGDAVVDDGYT